MSDLWYRLTVVAAKCTLKLLNLFGRDASHFPGVTALKLCPDFMTRAPKAPLVICVTGTNGKTTVSNLLTDALLADGKKVVSNRVGSNIAPGCSTNLLNSLNWCGKCRVDATVYEVDERASRLILPCLKPDFLIVTNLFRDSLKRNAHPDYIFGIINTYCPDTTKLILNADDLCSSRLKKNSERLYFGIGKQPSDFTRPYNIVSDCTLCPECGTALVYDYLHYHHIGRAHCPNCGFHSEDAGVLATDIDAGKMTLKVNINGVSAIFPLINDIIFNVYNELAVIAILVQLGFSIENISRIASQLHVPDSRLNSVCVGGIRIVQAMSKGQSCVSSCRTFDYVSSQPGKKAVVLAMDDAYDRKNSIEYISWIYDVDYEFLARAGVEQVVAAGPRCCDHKLRLLLAGVPEEKICCSYNELDAVDLIDADKVDSIYILYDTSTYLLSCKMKKRLLKKLNKK